MLRALTAVLRFGAALTAAAMVGRVADLAPPLVGAAVILALVLLR